MTRPHPSRSLATEQGVHHEGTAAELRRPVLGISGHPADLRKQTSATEQPRVRLQGTNQTPDLAVAAPPTMAQFTMVRVREGARCGRVGVHALGDSNPRPPQVPSGPGSVVAGARRNRPFLRECGLPLTRSVRLRWLKDQADVLRAAERQLHPVDHTTRCLVVATD